MTAEICFDAPSPAEGGRPTGTEVRDRLQPAFEELFSEVYREHFPRVVRLVVPVVRDMAIAEDVAQETMSRFMTRLEKLDTSTPVWPWLRTVAMRVAVDYFRMTNREVPCETHGVDEGELLGVCEDAHWCEEGPQLVAAMRGLPKRQRQALALRYLKDRDSAEVARALDLSKGALEQLVFRARRKMHQEYSKVAAHGA